MLIVAILAVLLFLFFINVPIAFSIYLTALLFIWLADLPLTMFIQRMFSGINSFPLLAIPLFIFVGTVMNHTSIANKLFDLAQALVGHIRGGLAHVNIVSSMLMAGISGSSTADAATSTKIMVPQMEKRGYPRPFSAAVTAASATIAQIIPPSVSFIIFGWLAGVSIGKLFIAGIFPGMLIGLSLIVTVLILSGKHGYGRDDKFAFSFKHLMKSFWDAKWSLLLALIIIGGILSGVFTATEAAGVAAVYVFLLGILMREIRWRDIPVIVKETVVDSAAVMLIVSAAAPFGWILTMEQIPQQVFHLFTSITDNYYLLLLLINLFLLLVGMFMDTAAALIIIIPMFMPLIQQMGMDPIHFGVMMVFNLMIGQLTPPVGTLMFTTCSISNTSIVDFQKALVPFYIAMFVALLLITYVPQFYMWLPNLVMR